MDIVVIEVRDRASSSTVSRIHSIQYRGQYSHARGAGMTLKGGQSDLCVYHSPLFPHIAEICMQSLAKSKRKTAAGLAPVLLGSATLIHGRFCRGTSRVPRSEPPRRNSWWLRRNIMELGSVPQQCKPICTVAQCQQEPV